MYYLKLIFTQSIEGCWFSKTSRYCTVILVVNVIVFVITWDTYLLATCYLLISGL